MTSSVCGAAGPAILGSTVSFAQPDALKGSLVVTLRQVQPTILFGVPRVCVVAPAVPILASPTLVTLCGCVAMCVRSCGRFEKMQEKLLEFGARNNCLLRRIGAWGKRKVGGCSHNTWWRRMLSRHGVTSAWRVQQGLQASRAVENRQPLPWGFWLANMLVFKNVKAGLGLTRCR